MNWQTVKLCSHCYGCGKKLNNFTGKVLCEVLCFYFITFIKLSNYVYKKTNYDCRLMHCKAVIVLRDLIFHMNALDNY